MRGDNDTASHIANRKIKARNIGNQEPRNSRRARCSIHDICRVEELTKSLRWYSKGVALTALRGGSAGKVQVWSASDGENKVQLRYIHVLAWMNAPVQCTFLTRPVSCKSLLLSDVEWHDTVIKRGSPIDVGVQQHTTSLLLFLHPAHFLSTIYQSVLYSIHKFSHRNFFFNMPNYAELPTGVTLETEIFKVAIPHDQQQDLLNLVRASKLGPQTYENTGEDGKYGLTYKWISEAKSYWENSFDWYICPRLYLQIMKLISLQDCGRKAYQCIPELHGKGHRR